MDMFILLKEIDADMYADDSTPTAQAKTVPDLEEKLNIYASIVFGWFSQ